jgi:hypothetical protein
VEYVVRSLYDNEVLDSLEAHVFVRAYHALWELRIGSEPLGAHAIVSLGLVIVFGEDYAV